MKKLSIDNLIEFRRKKTDNTKFTVLRDTQKEKIKEPGKGGHYWVCCLSVTSNVFKTNDKNLFNLKMDELRNWIEETDHEGE